MHKNISNKVNPGWIRLTLSIVLIAGSIIGYPVFNAAAEAWRSPEDLALDSQGNFYVSDSLLLQIKKLNPQGEAVAVLGEQIRDEDRHAWYYALASIRVDSQGAIYAVGIKQPYIQKLGSQGQFEKAIDTGGRQPLRLRIDSHDHLWLLFSDAPYIEEYDEAGHKLDSWSLPVQLEKMHSFELDQQGNFYILANDQVYKVDSEHKLLATWPTNHESMREIALDNQGFIYLADSHHIYKYDNQGKPLTGWNIPEKSFTFLSAVAVGRDNTLSMLGEQDNQTVILRFDNNGRPISRWN